MSLSLLSNLYPTAQGPIGNTGATGLQGATGSSFNIKGAVNLFDDLPSVDLEISDTYIVYNDGNLYTWNGLNWLNVGSYVGPIGSTGATGEFGATGLQGATGEFGATGLQGATGEFGATGLQGATGLDGATGLQGATGEFGATGLQGATGEFGSVLGLASYSWENNYQILPRDVDSNLKWDTENFNTDANLFELINSRIYIKTTGYYELISNIHIDDTDTNVEIYNIYLKIIKSTSENGAFSTIGLISNDKYYENNRSGILTGSTILYVSEPSYFSLSLLPLRRNVSLSKDIFTSSKIFIKKLYN